MDENQAATLQTLVEYYRNKCNKLEHDFVLYQAQAESIVRQLKSQIEGTQEGQPEQPEESEQPS